MMTRQHVPEVIDFERSRTGLRGSAPGEVCLACSDPEAGRWVPASFCPQASAVMKSTTGKAHRKEKEHPLKIACTITALAVATIAAAGCAGSTGSTAGSSTIPVASRLATAPAVKDARALVARCIPASATAQVGLGHRLLTDTKKHPNGSWGTLLACAGVTAQDKPLIEAKALAAAEKVNWASKAARHAYFEVTLPGIVTSFAGAATTPAAATR